MKRLKEGMRITRISEKLNNQKYNYTCDIIKKQDIIQGCKIKKQDITKK